MDKSSKIARNPLPDTPEGMVSRIKELEKERFNTLVAIKIIDIAERDLKISIKKNGLNQGVQEIREEHLELSIGSGLFGYSRRAINC